MQPATAIPAGREGEEEEEIISMLNNAVCQV
jgi:hypothetical protein